MGATQINPTLGPCHIIIGVIGLLIAWSENTFSVINLPYALTVQKAQKTTHHSELQAAYWSFLFNQVAKRWTDSDVGRTGRKSFDILRICWYRSVDGKREWDFSRVHATISYIVGWMVGPFVRPVRFLMFSFALMLLPNSTQLVLPCIWPCFWFWCRT